MSGVRLQGGASFPALGPMIRVASMATATERITAEEFLAGDEETRHRELIDGEVVVNQPSFAHQEAGTRLLVALAIWVDAAPGRGAAVMPVDVHVTDRDVYGPDVSWFAADHVAERRESLKRLPDLCVELRSPSTWRYDLGRKKDVYEDSGLPELWLVDDVAQSVLVYRRSSPKAAKFDVALELTAEESLSSPQLPGFSLPIASLFR